MGKKGISQEWLKGIACIAMLIDHIGAVFVLGNGYRIIGRIAFPIYCFLMAEGFAHTHDVKAYGKRLLIGAVLSELPFDFLFYGGFTWEHQSIMVTMVLGLLMMFWAKKKNNVILPLAVCFFLAEFLNTDYGGWGVALIGLFTLTAGKQYEWLLQTAGMALIFYLMDSYRVSFGAVQIPIQFFGLLAMLPIGLYSGRKLTGNKVIQWVFYLFYPLHLTILFLIRML